MCTKKRKEIGKKNLHELVLYEAGYTKGTIFKKTGKKEKSKDNKSEQKVSTEPY